MKREFSAGGVVIRRFRGRPFVAAVRLDRPKRTMALPKGHPEDGESMREAALREVREETGLEAEVVDKLGEVEYWYSLHGERVLKKVSFYLCRYRGGSIEDHDEEVAGVEWLPLDEAPSELAYRGEREMAALALSRL